MISIGFYRFLSCFYLISPTIIPVIILSFMVISANKSNPLFSFSFKIVSMSTLNMSVWLRWTLVKASWNYSPRVNEYFYAMPIASVFEAVECMLGKGKSGLSTCPSNRKQALDVKLGMNFGEKVTWPPYLTTPWRGMALPDALIESEINSNLLSFYEPIQFSHMDM